MHYHAVKWEMEVEKVCGEMFLLGFYKTEQGEVSSRLADRAELAHFTPLNFLISNKVLQGESQCLTQGIGKKTTFSLANMKTKGQRFTKLLPSDDLPDPRIRRSGGCLSAPCQNFQHIPDFFTSFSTTL